MPSILSLRIFLIKVWFIKMGYVLGNDEGTIVASESFSDLLDLVWSDVSEIGENDLFMSSEEFVQFLDLGKLFSSNLCTTSHLWFLINNLFDLLKNDFYQLLYLFFSYQQKSQI